MLQTRFLKTYLFFYYNTAKTLKPNKIAAAGKLIKKKFYVGLRKYSVNGMTPVNRKIIYRSGNSIFMDNQGIPTRLTSSKSSLKKPPDFYTCFAILVHQAILSGISSKCRKNVSKVVFTPQVLASYTLQRVP